MKGFASLFVLLSIISSFLLSNASSVSAQIEDYTNQRCAELCGGEMQCENLFSCDAYGVCKVFICPSCTGDSGRHGACVVDGCNDEWNDGSGSCTFATICCAKPASCPPQGTSACSHSCTTDADCVSGLKCEPTAHICYGRECETGRQCNYCVGETSGEPGVCFKQNTNDMESELCNEHFGTTEQICSVPSSNGTNRCCVVSNNPYFCFLHPTPPFIKNNTFDVAITSNVPFSVFEMADVDPTDPWGPSHFCTVNNPVTLDQYGNGVFRVTCPEAKEYYFEADTISEPQHYCSISIDVGSYDATCAYKCQSYPKNPLPICRFADDPQPVDCINSTIKCFTDPQSDCYCCPAASPVPSRPPLNPLCSDEGIDTAIGCIPTGNRNNLMVFILRWAIGFAGGVSFILIITSGLIYMTSGGDRQKVHSANELFTASALGLLLLIFSVYILNILGVRILKIPGL